MRLTQVSRHDLLLRRDRLSLPQRLGVMLAAGILAAGVAALGAALMRANPLGWAVIGGFAAIAFACTVVLGSRDEFNPILFGGMIVGGVELMFGLWMVSSDLVSSLHGFRYGLGITLEGLIIFFAFLIASWVLPNPD